MKKIRSSPVSQPSISVVKIVRRWVRSFFALSTSQANGLMVLIPVLLVLTVSEPLWRWWKVRNWRPNPQDMEQLDSLAIAWGSVLPDSNKLIPISERFVFDPNSVSMEQLISLGFDSPTAQRMINYRKKGGVFRSSKDLLKVYGIDSALCNSLAGFVKISQIVRPAAKLYRYGKDKSSAVKSENWPARKREEAFDINAADSARFEAVRGIGKKLSRRIVKYRSALGGFVHVEQLKEVFGLDSMALSNLMRLGFVAPDFLPDRIDLNMADERQLDAHPYVGRQEARAIVAYRFQHGRFASVSDLALLPIFDKEKIRRLEPYFRIGE